MVKPVNNITITTTKRNQRLQGGTSSTQQNVLQDEIIRDLINIRGQWNNGLVPLLATVPAGEDDPLINAFKNGLSGETLYTKASTNLAEAALGFYNTDQERPKTIYEQFIDVYDYVNQQIGTPTTAAPPSVAAAGKYIVVDEVSDRNQLDNVVDGMLVYVDSTRIIYIRDGGSWKVYKILPNYDIQADMDSTAAGISYLYVSSTGSDDTGLGTSIAPYREIQRAIQAIPPGLSGFLEIRALDAGPFYDFHVPELDARTLFIQIVGGGSSQLNMSGMSAGTSDVNAAGGVKSGRRRHAAGAHSAISNGTHWVKGGYDFGAGRLWSYGFTVDGANSTSPDISIIGHNQFSPDISTFGFTAIDLIPFTSSIIPKNGSFYHMSLTPQSTVQVTVIGFYITQFGYLENVDVQGVALRSTGGVVIYTDAPSHYPVYNFYVNGQVTAHGHGSNSIYMSGLILSTVSLQGVHTSFYGVIRTTANPQMQVGYSSSTGPRKASSVIMVGDFEGASLRCISAPGSSVRISDNGSTITLDGTQATFIETWNYSDVIGTQSFPTVYGSTTGVPIILRDHAHTLCLTATGYGSSPYLRNSSTPGSDVQIGGENGFFNGIVVAFTELPVTELNSECKAS